VSTPSSKVNTNKSKPRPFEPHEGSATRKIKADPKSGPPARWWFGNGSQLLGVGAGRFRSGLTVRKTAVTFEDGVVGAADFVEKAQRVTPFRSELHGTDAAKCTRTPMRPASLCHDMKNFPFGQRCEACGRMRGGQPHNAIAIRGDQRKDLPRRLARDGRCRPWCPALRLGRDPHGSRALRDILRRTPGLHGCL